MAQVTGLSAAANQVNAEAKKIADDNAFIASNKNNPTALAGRIDEFQADYKAFQTDSAGLQQSSDLNDVLTAQTAEAGVYDGFDAAQVNLKEALGGADAQAALSAGDPTVTHLQSGVESLIDEGNANVLHLQQLNNNLPSINQRTGADAHGDPLTPMYSLQGGSYSESVQYGNGTANGAPVGVISGGTASPNDVAQVADAVRVASGQPRDDAPVGNNDA